MIVVDASAVVDALTMPAGTEALRRRLVDEDLHAPHLIDYEVVSVLRGLARAGQVSAHRAADALGDFHDLPIERWSGSRALSQRAFQLRHNLSAYDAAYVTLAEALECPLVTRDAKLVKAVGSTVRAELV